MAHYPTSGVAGVDHQFRAIHNGAVIVAGVIRGDDYAVVGREGLRGDGHGLHFFVVIMSHFVQLREVRVVIVEIHATLLEQFHDFQCGRFAQIVDVFFVRDTEDEQFGAFETFFLIVERGGDGVDNVVRHRGIHFAGEFNETRGEIEFARFP
jgi:hypothetical protein